MTRSSAPRQDKKSLGRSSQAPRVALSPLHWSRLCQLVFVFVFVYICFVVFVSICFVFTINVVSLRHPCAGHAFAPTFFVFSMLVFVFVFVFALYFLMYLQLLLYRSVTPALVTPLPTLLLHFSYFPYLYLYLFALYLQLLEATLV